MKIFENKIVTFRKTKYDDLIQFFEILVYKIFGNLHRNLTLQR